MQIDPHLMNAAERAFNEAVENGMMHGADGLDAAVWIAEALKARAATCFAQRGEGYGHFDHPENDNG